MRKLPNAEAAAYWLENCVGFEVRSPRGRVGVVEEILLGIANRPAALCVLAGLFGRRTLLVPVADVDQIVPGRMRVDLRAAH